MELQKVIEMRQSIRRYKKGDIPDGHITQMVQAAGMAPSGKNIQNWHFVAIKNRNLKERIRDVIDVKNAEIVSDMEKVDEEKALRFRKFFKNFTGFFVEAPVLFVIYSKIYEPSGYNEYKLIDADDTTLNFLLEHLNPGMQSLGAAIENLTLKAIDLGYGSCWLTSANYAAKEIEQLLKDEVGFSKENFFMAAMLAVGIPEENQKSPKKKAVEEILTVIE